MNHGDKRFLPSAARTRTVWDDTPHLAYYDDPATLDRAARAAAEWFHAS